MRFSQEGIRNLRCRGSGNWKPWGWVCAWYWRRAHLSFLAGIQSGSNAFYRKQFLGTRVWEYARDVCNGQVQPRICTGSKLCVELCSWAQRRQSRINPPAVLTPWFAYSVIPAPGDLLNFLDLVCFSRIFFAIVTFFTFSPLSWYCVSRRPLFIW